MVQSLQHGTLEERVTRLHELKNKAPNSMLDRFYERLDISWIYHDSALEGVVYSMDELKAAIDEQVVSDSSLIPVYDEIRNHKAAIDLIRDLSHKKRLSISIELVKKIYVTLVPEEGEGKGAPRYRKDMPLHRLYFHDIAPPEKISYQMRQLFQWINSADTKRSTHTVRLAAKAHAKLIEIYPFPKHSGKVARLLMNLMLRRAGYPPVIIHATERQRYYDALKTSPDATAKIVTEALAASVESTVRYLEEELGEETVTSVG